MKLRIDCVAGLLILLIVAIAAPCSFASGKDRPVISAAEKAVAALEVQNVMSRHAYYHGAGKNCEELDAIWVKNTPVPTFSNPIGSWVGMDHIKSSYCETNLDNQKKTLEALKKKYPEIKEGRENFGVGEWLIHTLTTPIIEIAGDGKTAKAMWYSPGAYIGAKPDGTASGTWFFEKYGVDFAKEDGQWRIWHIQMFYDFTGPLEKGFADVPIKEEASLTSAAIAITAEAGERKMEDPRMKMQRSQPNPYKEWGPTTVPAIVRMPEPYYTFSETFSY